MRLLLLSFYIVLATSAVAQNTDAPAPELPFELAFPYKYENYIPDTNGPRLQTGLYFNKASPQAVWRHYMGSEVSILPKPFVTRRDFDSVAMHEGQGDMAPGYGIVIRLTPAGARALEKASRRSKGGRFVVVLANRVMAVPTVAAIITSGQLWLSLPEHNRLFLEALVEEVGRDAPRVSE